MKKVLFWDFDGTLALPNESFAEALYGVLHDQGTAFSMVQARDILRSVSTWYRPDDIYPGRTGGSWWSDMLDRLESRLNAGDIACDFERLGTDFQNRIISYHYTLYDDAEDSLIHCIELGYTNYIMSNNFPELKDTIRRFRLDKYFAGYSISAAVGYEKPRIELFRYGLDMAGRPEISYMIGDNPIADIQGGNAAGMKTILVHNDCENEAMHVCKTLSEIPALLE